MARALNSRQPETVVYPVPEPDLTPEEIIARARALRSRLRAEQDEAEERGGYSDGMHREFLNAGFYRILQPRMFGGYEFDITTFYKTMLEISIGHPGTGWCLTLCASHPWVVGSHWDEAGQRALFGPDGNFSAPHRAPPTGTATPAPGGYRINGQWDYCSGIPHATHFLGVARDLGSDDKNATVTFVMPKKQLRVLDDWGGDKTLGMRASGSNSVKIEDQFIPKSYTTYGYGLWRAEATTAKGTPGTRLHGNPMYLGRTSGPYHMSLVTPILGAARAALDEFAHIITNKPARHAPDMLRFRHADYQRTWGQARSLADAAEGIMWAAGDKYMWQCRRWAETGQAISLEDDLRLWGMIQHAGRLAGEAVDVVFCNASSAATKKGQKIERYYRDVAMYKSHISSQVLNFAAPIARAHFGLSVGMFGM
jgi:3-hydroxy-9,10-secoandrosta-1,3,5(10)-triene-9,17-dione monooxygenase